MTQELSLLPIGVGSGTTSVLHGEPSSSFAILADNDCRLLVDLGHGVARAVVNHLTDLPQHVYLSHNHTDHTADFPVIARLMASLRLPVTVWCTETVRRRVQEHRLHEFAEAGVSPDNLARWMDTPVGRKTELDSEFSLTPRQSQHSEACFGFILSYLGKPILGYSADSGYNETYYEWLCQAPVLVLDGRSENTSDHAGFKQIKDFSGAHSGHAIYITHYGRLDQAPSDLEPLRPGEPISLAV